MILGAVIFVVGLSLAVLAYWAGRADGWQQGVSETRRAYREETARLNMRRNAALINETILKE